MEGTEVQPFFIYIPVFGAVFFVILVFTFGFRSSTQPPSSMFEDENEKRNRRGRRVKKLSVSDPKPSTNGHAKLLMDSPREVKQVKGQKVEQDPEMETAPKVSPKKEKLAKSKGGEVHAGKEQDVPKKDAVMTRNKKDKEKDKDEGDAWITVTAPSRKEKKQNKQTFVHNGEQAKPTNKSPIVSSTCKSSGDVQKASQKGKKDEIAKDGGGEKVSKEAPQKVKGSPKKNQIKASTIPTTQSAPSPESSPDQGKKRKKKGQPELQETVTRTTSGSTNGSVTDSNLTSQKKDVGEDEDGFTPGKSRRNRKKQKTTPEDTAKQLPPAEDKKQKSPSTSPKDFTSKKSGKKSPDKLSSPSKSKQAAKTDDASAALTPEGSPLKTSKKAEGKASSSTKNQKNGKKDDASQAKSDPQPGKDKKNAQKTNKPVTSSADTSPAKTKSFPEGSPTKSGKKRGGEKPSQQVKKDDKQLQESKPQPSSSPVTTPDVKSKIKKKTKKESTPPTPDSTYKQPASPTNEILQSTEPKVDNVNNKTTGKKNKRKGDNENKGKSTEIVNGETSHSLPLINAKDVSDAKTPDTSCDKPPSGTPTSQPDLQEAAAREQVAEVQENDNWVEAKPKKVRKKVRRDL